MPRPKGSKNKVQGKNKREDLLDAAMRVFCHYGYDGASLETIAKSAGTTRPLVNTYFGSKQKLAEECIRRFLTGFFQNMVKIHTKSEDYREVVNLMAEQFAIYRSEWRFVMAILCTPSLEALHREIVPANMKLAAQLIGKRGEELADPDDTAALTFLISAAHMGHVLGSNVENYRRGINSLLDHYMK